MRLKPLHSLEQAQRGLDYALSEFSNARSGMSHHSQLAGYLQVVSNVLPHLESFAEPDLAAQMQSGAYWHLFSLFTVPDQATVAQAVYRELDVQIAALTKARKELQALAAYAARPGVPVVYDTVVLNHFADPSAVLWNEVSKAEGLSAGPVRLVVPQDVIVELDRQKYGEGLLAKRASKAIVYLERTLKGVGPGEAVEVRKGATLELRLAPPGPHRGEEDVDWQILLCADELQHLVPQAGVRVLSDDTNMHLRAAQLGLQAMRLPENYRKPNSAFGEARAQQP